MNILPVLDLLNGIVVRGIAGRRSEYQPLHSILTSSAQPLDVARALRERFGFDQIYVADLDAILTRKVNWDTYQRLVNDGFQLLVDAGIHDAPLACEIVQLGAEPVAGLESCRSPDCLQEITTAVNGLVTFSLDLVEGRPLSPCEAIQRPCSNMNSGLSNDGEIFCSSESYPWDTDPAEIARQAVHAGVSRMIVLDLADVGTFSGGRTESLCQWIRKEFFNLPLICGGGIRGVADLIRMRNLGAASVLVASALHDGRLQPEDLQQIEPPQ